MLDRACLCVAGLMDGPEVELTRTTISILSLSPELRGCAGNGGYLGTWLIYSRRMPLSTSSNRAPRGSRNDENRYRRASRNTTQLNQ